MMNRIPIGMYFFVSPRVMVLGICLCLITIHGNAEGTKASYRLEYLDIEAVEMVDALRLIAELSGMNLVSTEEAQKETITIYLQDVTALEAIDAICKVTGLWYRHDPKSDVYRVMTTKQYQNDLVVRQDYEIKIFDLRYPNADSIAPEIEDLFGNRVILSLEDGVFDFAEFETLSDSGSGSSSSNRGGGNRRSRRNRDGDRGRDRVSSRGFGGRRSFSRGVRDTEFGILRNVELSTGQLEALEQSQENIKLPDSIEAQQGLVFGIQDPLIYVTVNREHNLIIVRTTDLVALEEIGELIKELDRPIPQVLLEMKILELTIGNDFKSIFDYDIASNKVEVGPPTNQIRNPLAPDSTTGVEQVLGIGGFPLEGNTLVYQFVNDNIIARVQLLAEDQKVNILATPMIVAVNNRPAEIVVAEERVLTTGVSSDVQTGENVNLTTIDVETEIRNIGLTLRIIPRINADGAVTLYIEQDSSTVVPDGSTIPISTGLGDITEFNVDSVNTANLEATVQAKDGLTVAVGGLVRTTISDTTQKVPFLGDLPMLGKLFRKDTEERQKTELVLLITPHILWTAEQGQAKTEERIEELSNHSYHLMGQDEFDQQIKEIRKQEEKENLELEAFEEGEIEE